MERTTNEPATPEEPLAWRSLGAVAGLLADRAAALRAARAAQEDAGYLAARLGLAAE